MTQHDVLYTWGTPNGRKPLLLLEELGIPYELRRVNIGRGEQSTLDFRARNGNERIPVLETTIDGETVAIAESAAILVHLAEREGRFLALSGAARARAMQWVMFQMSAVGPMLGQLGHFRRQQPDNERAIERFAVEARRIFGVLDSRLRDARYLAGDDYGIADMTTFFWTRKPAHYGVDVEAHPGVKRWLEELEARPAVQRTLAISFP